MDSLPRPPRALRLQPREPHVLDAADVDLELRRAGGRVPVVALDLDCSSCIRRDARAPRAAGVLGGRVHRSEMEQRHASQENRWHHVDRCWRDLAVTMYVRNAI